MGTKRTADFNQEAVRVALTSGLTEQANADRLGKPHSFMAKVEGLTRRIDIVEFFEISEAIGFDPLPLMKDV